MLLLRSAGNLSMASITMLRLLRQRDVRLLPLFIRLLVGRQAFFPMPFLHARLRLLSLQQLQSSFSDHLSPEDTEC